MRAAGAPGGPGKLTTAQQEYVVERLAAFDNPGTVAHGVREKFGITLTRQAVEQYDPTRDRRCPARWTTLFWLRRQAILESKGLHGAVAPGGAVAQPRARRPVRHRGARRRHARDAGAADRRRGGATRRHAAHRRGARPRDPGAAGRGAARWTRRKLTPASPPCSPTARPGSTRCFVPAPPVRCGRRSRATRRRSRPTTRPPISCSMAARPAAARATCCSASRSPRTCAR